MSQTIRNSYYAYKLINSKDNKPFYVGKGYSTRMYAHKTEALKDKDEWTNPHKCRKILKLLNGGHKIIYDYVLCESETKALELERKWISKIGLCNLTNISEEGQVAHPITKPIDVYNLDGKLVGQYKSAASATRNLKICDVGIIRRCLNNYDTLQTYKGMVFTYKGKKFNYKNNKVKLVIAESSQETLTFSSTIEAAKFLNRSKSCVRQCCKNHWNIDKYKMKYGE